MEGVFDTATITFSFNSELLKLDNFKPCIYYYNEDTQLLEELPDQTIKDNTVSVNTTHFSKYILLNKYSYDEVWKEDIRKPSENYNNMDIVFVVDISFSMSYNDPEYIRKTVTNGFVNNLRNGDRAALVTFRKNAEIKQELTDNKNDIVNAVNILHNDDGYNDFSGTNGSLGLYTAYKLFDDKVNTDKVIIFLTDGEDTEITYDYNNIISQAADNNICIYTIGLGSSIDENLLKMIASKTHGKYYKSDVATDLITDFDAIFNEYTDYYTDSNNDGISDYFTALMCSGVLVTGTGKKLFQGIPMSEIQKNSDYDNDGIKNGDEVKVIFDSKHKKVYLKVISSPVENDTDKDGVKDNIDQNKLKKDIYEKLLLIVNNGRFKTENVNRLTKINYAIIKINTEKCHNNSTEEMNSYILQQCKLRLGKRLTLEYMYDYKLLKETLLELMEYDADLINSLKNRSLFINENNLFKILSSTAYMVTNFKENLENDNILSFIREETTTITNVLAIAKKTKMLTKELYKSGIEITDYINKEIKVPKIKQL